VTEAPLPSLAKDLRESELPSETNDTTETCWRLVTVDPTERKLPSWTPSRTDTVPPKEALDNTEMELPNLTKLLKD